MWTPSSWQEHAIKQQPAWPDPAALKASLKQISTLPPLVFAGEARSLQTELGRVASGNAFLLQAGDCAESFEDFSADNIREKLRVILNNTQRPLDSYIKRPERYTVWTPCGLLKTANRFSSERLVELRPPDADGGWDSIRCRGYDGFVDFVLGV